jgi:tRNA1Val (adenine37-N6)-methyltransferase
MERKGFCVQEQLLVKQSPQHDFFRTILLCSKINSVTKESTLIIKDVNGKYTVEFTGLLKDYYLYL